MIKFEILESTDHDSIGEHTFIYPSIEIGVKPKSTLRVFDNSVATPIHLKTIGENKGIVITDIGSGFLCNSKKCFISTIVKPGDIIEIKDLKIKINEIKIDEKFPIDIKRLRKEITSYLQSHNPAQLEILAAIEEDLINLGIL